MEFVDFSGLFGVMFNADSYPLTITLLSALVILFCVSVIVRIVRFSFGGR